MIHKAMQQQKQDNAYTCTAVAFAMALGIAKHKILKQLPDPSEIIWPIAQHGYRGHHTQELIDLCYSYGQSVMQIDVMPVFSHFSGELQGQTRAYGLEDHFVERLKNYLEYNYGVLTGTIGFNAGHAVAWDGEKVYDPMGLVRFDLEFMNIQHFFIFK